MKNFNLLILLVFVLCSCSKDPNDFAVEEQYDSELSADESLLKSQLSKAASVLSRLTSVSEVEEELKSIGSTFEIADSSFSLKDILTQEPILKSTEDRFANLRACFYKNRDLKSASPIDSLLSSIIDYDYVMWMPYPLEWYPDDRQFLTIVSHPLDNEVEGIGYRWINGKLEEVLVNDDYNEEYPVLIVTPKYLAGDDLNLNLSSSLKSSMGDEVLQVRIGEFRTKSKFGTGFFKKNVAFEIHRGKGR